ncbi:GAF and ANTAR domain-containing protein [Mycolicibacterium neoaurum]|uniref:GAF and ANTAR domain-containing protein n=1 Tax=Mycolicibacterium neoaurum TaxID=1795 RepID=UPI00248D0724|nr:GAF and ANTAR domain-containing protein [Mycolicibacterium neoaurum]WBP96356.1 GAF and ANTAR domain-containing protein [Mycolicibacterium neoaurum]WBS10113.1 GAF and ANTAR domain-containing protein [Mycolicibacterium neoaurum]
MTGRNDHVWNAIVLRAAREGLSISPRHACSSCAETLGVSGASLLLTGGPRQLEPVCVTGGRAAELEERQITIGQGPAFEALHSGRPVLVDDLAASSAAGRWPLFGSEAERLGIKAIYSLPLTLGALQAGVLDLFHRAPCVLDHEQLVDALIFADTALLLLIDSRSGIVAQPGGNQTEPSGPDLWRAEVHQATGMLSVQLGIPVVDALVMLRTHAYHRGEQLADVARMVVEHRLRLRPAGPESPGASG